MIKTIREWYGANNSALFLCLNSNEDEKPFLSIEYGSSLTGNHFESGRRFFPIDLEENNGELQLIIKSEFSDNCMIELTSEIEMQK